MSSELRARLCAQPSVPASWWEVSASGTGDLWRSCPGWGLWGRPWGPAGAEAAAGKQTAQPVCIGTTLSASSKKLWSLSASQGGWRALHSPS